MDKCPRCREPLYPINSTSKEKECLNKICGFSTVKKVGCRCSNLDEPDMSTPLPEQPKIKNDS